MPGRPTYWESQMIARRRADAMELRLAGVDYLSIGRKLAADPARNSDGESYPYGYGRDAHEAGEDPPDDEHLANLVSEDLRRAIRARAAQMDKNYAELKAIQDARIERLTVAHWRKALGGDFAATDRVLRLLERSAKLHGLDSPTRTELTGAEGGPIEVSAVDKARQEALAHLQVLATQRAVGGVADEDAGAIAALEEIEDDGVMATDLGNGE